MSELNNTKLYFTGEFGFSNYGTINILNQVILWGWGGEGFLAHCIMLNSITGLYPPD